MGRYGFTKYVEITWDCDFCGEVFNNYNNALMHIHQCENRKKGGVKK